MSDPLVQCLIFCKFRSGVKAYALLPQVFRMKNPNIMKVLNEYGIILICNSDLSRIKRGEKFADLLEIFLDHSSSATLARLSFVSNNDRSALSLLFCNKCVRVGRKSDDGTGVQLAVDYDNFEVFKRLLSCKFCINEKGACSLLHLGADRNQEALVELSLKYGADTDGTLEDGSTVLHWAAAKGSSTILQQLLEKGADVDAKDSKGNTPVLIAKHPDVLKILIHAKNSRGQTALHEAARQGNSSHAQQLIERGANVDAISEMDGCTPLHYAVTHEEVVKILLANDASIEVKNNKGKLPLHFAADKGSRPVVQLLIDKGAIVDAKNEKDGCTPLHYAVRHKEVVETLLTNGASLHEKNTKGNTPLHLAVRNGTLSVVQLLIERGAAVDARDGKGRSLLHLVDNPEIADLLLQNGADPNYSAFGLEAPLFRACKNKSLDLIKLLLKYGARVDVESNSLLQIAASREKIEVFQYLLERCFVDPTLLDSSIDEFTNWFVSGHHAYCLHILACHLKKIQILNIKPFSFEGRLAELIGGWLLEDWDDLGPDEELDEDDEEEIAELKSAYEMEVARMKSLTLCDTGVSLYDILTRSEHGIAHLLRNKFVALKLDKIDWAKKFSAYGRILSYHIEKGKLRISIQEEGMKIFDYLFRSPQQMPDEMKELILSYLSNEDIFTLKRACSRL